MGVLFIARNGGLTATHALWQQQPAGSSQPLTDSFTKEHDVGEFHEGSGNSISALMIDK